MLIKIQIAKKQESKAKPKTKTSKTILSYLKSLLNVKVVNPLPRPRKSPSISISGSAFARGNGKHLRRQNVLGQMKSVFIPNFNGKNFAYFLSKRFFMLPRICQMKITPAHSHLIFLPLLGFPNKLMPFYLFFTNTLRAEQNA